VPAHSSRGCRRLRGTSMRGARCTTKEPLNASSTLSCVQGQGVGVGFGCLCARRVAEWCGLRHDTTHRTRQVSRHLWVGLTGAVACVVQHAKDRAYITATEHATEWGGFKKQVRSGSVLVFAAAVASGRTDRSTSSKHCCRTVGRSSTHPVCLLALPAPLTWAICGLMYRAMPNSNSCPSSAAL
jgi:hypothetical protein